MASEIMPDPAAMVKSDLPESSMAREPQSITINQGSLRNLLECITQMKEEFQQISLAQELKKKDTQPTLVPPGLSPKVVEEFRVHLSSGKCARLLDMVNEFPSELFLETVDEEYSRSALHVAVLKGSEELIYALVEKLKAHSGGNDSKFVEHDFIQKADKFRLSAVDMAALIANDKIISCLSKLGLEFWPRFDNAQFPRFPTSEDEKKKLHENASHLLGKLAPTSSDQEIGELSLQEWLDENDVDFVYCLHEAAMNSLPSQRKALEFVEYVCGNGDFLFLEPLLKVRDSLGRTPLHVHDNPKCLPLFEKLVDNFPTLDWNMQDFCGRTPSHWAAAQGNKDLVTFLAEKTKTKLDAKYEGAYGITMEPSTIFNYDGVMNMTPLHLAVIHNHIEVVEALLKVEKERELEVNALCLWQHKDMNETSKDSLWTPIQLAAYMGHTQILKKFLKDPRSYDPGLENKGEKPPRHNMIPALHLAASQFHPAAVKTLTSFRKIDVFKKDNGGLTALHYATMHAHGCLQIHANLYDYVTVSHFTSKSSQSRKLCDQDMITCIGILIQFGLGMETRNIDEKAPTLHPLCPEKVQTWWIEKIANEEQENKNNLLSAANAVSIIATLVATLSFVGPLQPPLGLLDDGNQTWLDGYSQVKHTPVEVFLFCNSLSFYFAIVAIMFTMLPSWPIPRDWGAIEVRFAHRCVQVAVLFLFGSIIFVVCAFSAANIAIVPNKRWRYKTIAVISTSFGVLICSIILFISFMRLLILLLSRGKFAKRIWNFAIRIMLWESDRDLV